MAKNRYRIEGWVGPEKTSIASGYSCRCRTGGENRFLVFAGDCQQHEGLTIQFYGRLYNKTELAAYGGVDIKNEEISDATVIMAAFLQKGTQLFALMEGLFAFVLYDSRTQKLYLVRDHIGAKSLYYYHDHAEGVFAFCERLKGFGKFTFFRKQLDLASLGCYFQYGFILQPNTIYQGCKKVEAGAYLIYDVAKDHLEETYYWDLGHCYDHPKENFTVAQITDLAHMKLQESIRKRLGGDSRAAVLLSGGYDSATVAAILKSQIEDVHTYTIGFQQRYIDESPYAAQIAKALSTTHHTYYFTQEDAKNIVPNLSAVYEEPFFDDGSIPTQLLARKIADDGIETVFGGDGGDEVFATADNYRQFRKLLHIPYTLRHTVAALLKSIPLQHLLCCDTRYNIATRFDKLLRFLDAKDVSDMVETRMILFHRSQIGRLMKTPPPSCQSRFDKIYFGPFAQTADKITGSYFQTFMLDGELVKTTQAFGYVGIDVREPYLDRELIALMAQTDESLKLYGGIKKFLLKEIAYRYLPKKLLDRPKHGLTLPTAEWMRGGLRELVIDTINYENIAKDGILDPRFVVRIRDAFFNGDEIYRYKLWSILLYQLWYQAKMR